MTGPRDSTRTGAGTLTVAVTFFGALRRFLPKGTDGPQRYTVPARATVGDLLAVIGLAPEDDLTIAVDGEQSSRDTPLRDGATVMLLSPMEGGAAAEGEATTWREGGAADELTVEDQPRRDDVALLDERLYEFNASASGVRDGRLLAVFVRDPSGTIVAGMHGWTWGGTGFVQAIWVHETRRGRGFGSRVLAAAEAEARRRGCHQMHLDTHSYQAPAFYQKLGYEIIGQLPGWPADDVRIFFRKRLV
jgi:ribosomal protein S18 acetylase RimI-like enzyme